MSLKETIFVITEKTLATITDDELIDALRSHGVKEAFQKSYSNEPSNKGQGVMEERVIENELRRYMHLDRRSQIDQVYNRLSYLQNLHRGVLIKEKNA